jgi:hypothetical protein
MLQGTNLHRLHSVVFRRAILIVAWFGLIRFAGSAGAESVTLAWDPSAEPHIGYNVYRSDRSGVFTALPLNGTSVVTTTSFTDSSVQNSQTYYYAVTAVSAGGLESAYSSQVQVQVGQESITTGYARIHTQDDGFKGPGLAMVGYSQDGVLVSETVFSASPLIQNGRVYVQFEDNVNTGIAISNPNGEPVALAFYFTDAGGSNLYSGSTVMPPNAHIVTFLNEHPFVPPASMDLRRARTFTFSASSPMAFAAVRGFINERSEFLMTSLPIAALHSSEFSSVAIPHYVDGGNQGGTWDNHIVLVNPTDQAISGVVQFFLPRDGASTTANATVSSGEPAQVFSYSIPSGSAVILERFREESQLSEGWVRVSPSFGMPTPSVLSLLSLRTGGITVTDSVMAAVAEDSAFRVYVESFGEPDENGSVRTGVAISNSRATPVAVRLELFGLDGTPTGLYADAALPPMGQVTLFLDQVDAFRSSLPQFSGFVRISGASVAAVGLKRRYNQRGDLLLTTIPVLPESGLAGPSHPIFFASGAGYTTRFIVFAPRTRL